MCWHVYTQALRNTIGANDDCSLGGALDRNLTAGRRFEHYFGSRGWEFEAPNLQKIK